MNIQDLRKKLENSSNKFNIFSNREIFAQCDNLKVSDLIGLIVDFLSDGLKKKLFELEHFQKLSPHIRVQIIKSISDENIRLQLLENPNAVSDFDKFNIIDIIKTFNDDKIKMQILRKVELLNQYGISDYDTKDIIASLSSENRRSILLDVNLMKEGLNFSDYRLTEIIAEFDSESTKTEMIQLYKFEKHQYQLLTILKTFSDSSKTEMLLSNQYKLKNYQLVELAASLSVDQLLSLFKNEQFFRQNNIKKYEITKMLGKEQQMEFLSKLEEANLSIDEKRQILATFSKEAKEGIDTSNLPPEYVSALTMQMDDVGGNILGYGKILVDFDDDLEIYRGLDELISINAMTLSTEERDRLLELCKICPQVKIMDNIGLKGSTPQEYINGEKIIDSILQGIQEDWTDIQKIAYIDHSIGKRISYTPDFDTEVFSAGAARALWKIIDSGYGVCNGIAQVEQYILSKVGIEAKIVSGKNHAFLKLENIELPNTDGTNSVGDTILDPTWNLTAHRYGGRPNNFCRSYDEIRKQDIKSDGTDAECHKNDEDLSSAKLELDDQCLRDVFKSIGIACEDGTFPIGNLLDASDELDKQNLPTGEALKKLLSLIENFCPEFATCQNSTSSIIQSLINDQQNLNFDRCVVNRVYNREDAKKRPILYVYIDSQDTGKKFYFADEKSGHFIESDQKEFEEKFECYEIDMERNDGHRPWEDAQKIESIEDLTRSSGKVVASEGDER